MVSETPRMLRIVINRKKDRIQSMNTKLTVMIIVWYAGLGFGLYRAQKAGIFESLLTKIKSYIFWPRSRVGARSFWLLCLVEVYHLLRKINFWFYFLLRKNLNRTNWTESFSEKPEKSVLNVWLRHAICEPFERNWLVLLV